MKKFTIYIGNMVGITVEGESKKIVEDIFCNSTLEWLNLKKEDYL